MFVVKCAENIKINDKKINNRKELCQEILKTYREHKGKIYLKGDSVRNKRKFKEISEMFCFTVVDLEPQPYLKFSLKTLLVPDLELYKY